tara:strand:- start:293 stop:490 length:198 start_codon:yes stop_codon:yes gene_type:complete
VDLREKYEQAYKEALEEIGEERFMFIREQLKNPVDAYVVTHAVMTESERRHFRLLSSLLVDMIDK